MGSDRGFGLGRLDDAGEFDPATARFRLYDNSEDPGIYSQGSMEDLITSEDELARYHMILVPCQGYAALSVLCDDPQAAANMRAWVAAGGRLYATDHHTSALPHRGLATR